ncbi:VanZ family protein [Gorillibacterium sp. sgz5001074]|uniref:VanZ family protein n=1 Tax=Gorillibacterium sp. sgz5001074 TaxID=3446695 RepID=UPI003F67BDC0
MGFLILSILWLGVIFLFSSQPYQKQTIIPFLQKHVSESKLESKLPDVTIRYHDSTVNSQKRPYQFLEFLFRKSAHVTIYAVYGFLLFNSMVRIREHGLVKGYIVLCLLLLTACFDEWNQTRIQQRTGIVQDLGFDFTGGLIGICFAAWWERFFKRRIS